MISVCELIRTTDLCMDFKVGDETLSVLKNISLSINRNKFTILKGRSGSGKTTLINLLGAMSLPTSGNIIFDGKDITTLSPPEQDELRRTQIGFVFQSGALLPNMTLYENVEFALRVSKPEIKDRKERVNECLRLVGLLKRASHFPQELSGGEVQRAAIARALCPSPKVIFADEPTSALDTLTALQVVKLFKDLIKEQDITIVMTTHDPNMLEIADNVFALEDGEIIHA